MATSFDQIVGHESQLALLRTLIGQGKVAGTYLFCGPEHVGKESVAMALAKALLCEVAERLGCSQCKACREVDSLLHPDLTVLEPAGKSQTIPKEEIERLRQRTHLSSFYGGWKVGIIQEAHHLHPQAAPALLKILEEPPDRSVFVLISHQESRVLPTLRSRCKVIPFFPLPERLVAEALAKGLGEDAQPSRDLLQPAVNLCAGRLGLGLRILRGDFLPRRDKILALLEELAPGQFFSVLTTVEGLLALAKPVKVSQGARSSQASAEDGQEVPSDNSEEGKRREERDVLFGLETLLRDAWVLQGMGKGPLMHSDREERLAKLSKKWGDAPLAEVLSFLQDARKDLEWNVSLRLILENAFLMLSRKEGIPA